MGHKTLDSITIYLNWQDKHQIEDEARENNLSLSNLIRLKIGLPELKVGRKKSVDCAQIVTASDEHQAVPEEAETAQPDRFPDKIMQQNLFDRFGSEP